MAMGQNSNRPSKHQPIPTKIGSKIGGEFTYPKMVPLVLTHGHMCKPLGPEPLRESAFKYSPACLLLWCCCLLDSFAKPCVCFRLLSGAAFEFHRQTPCLGMTATRKVPGSQKSSKCQLWTRSSSREVRIRPPLFLCSLF